MLGPLPAPLHRAALRVAHTLRLAWWSVRRPHLHGCNAIVFNPRGEVLLVRHSYQAPELWMLPGGGLRAGESPEQAAEREVAEEVGCAIAGARCFDVETVALVGARNHIHLVVANTRDAAHADGREIVAAQFFDPANLPPAMTEAAGRRIAQALAFQNSES